MWRRVVSGIVLVGLIGSYHAFRKRKKESVSNVAVNTLSVTGVRFGLVSAAVPLASPKVEMNSLEQTDRTALEVYQRSGREAAEVGSEIQDEEQRTIFYRAIARQWGMSRSEELIRWADSLADPNDSRKMKEFVCYRVAEQDPVRALQLARSVGFENDSVQISELVTQWAASDGRTARNWVLAMPEGELKEKLLSQVLVEYAQMEPVDAARIVATQMKNGPHRAAAVLTVVHAWGKRDLPAAQGWVRTFGEGPLRAQAEQELAGIAAHLAGRRLDVADGL